MPHPRDPERLRLRAQAGGLARQHPDDPDVAIDARRTLKEQRILLAIRSGVALTLPQRARLAAMLLDAPGGGAA